MVRRHPTKQAKPRPDGIKQYTEEQYEEVMRQVRQQHLKYSEIATRTGVNKNTIKRWASVPIKYIGTGKGLALTVDEELDFVACLHHLADYWFPVGRNTLKDLV